MTDKERMYNEFYDLCRKYISESSAPVILNEIIERAINTKASSFFLSELTLGKILRADISKIRNSYRYELYNDIRRRYAKIKANYPNMKAESIAKHILYFMPAPRFYFSVNRGHQIYIHILKKRQNERKRKNI